MVRCNYDPSSSSPPVSSIVSSVSACIMSTVSYPSSMSAIVTSSSIPVAASSSTTPLSLSRMGYYQKCSFVVVCCSWLASGTFCGMTLIWNIICGLCHCYKYCQAPGPVQCPGQGPGKGPVSSPWSRSRHELRNLKFSVKFSKERTWRDTIIKQATTTTPPLNFLKLLP